MKKSAFLQGTNVVAFIVTVAVNILAGNTTLLGGKMSGDISDLYPTLITPAGSRYETLKSRAGSQREKGN